MKKYSFLIIMLLTVFLVTACNESKEIVCTRSEGTETTTKIIAQFDSNNKVNKVDLQLLYPNKEQAEMDLETFQKVFGSNVELKDSTIFITNAPTLKDSAFSDVIGYTRSEFKSYFKSYTCE